MTFEDRVSDTIADAIHAGELGDETNGIPAGWVLVSTYYDSEGTLRLGITANDDAQLHETLGLLDMAKAVYHEEARTWVLGMRDD